jgi:hypothetical protein
MYYKKVLIKSEEDLPKEGNTYFALTKNGKKIAMFWDDEDTEYSTKVWVRTNDWYLQPIDNPEIDLREELIKFAQQFYADEETCKSNIDKYLKSQKQCT